ncbi:MAG: HNH endonuclease [Alphaproteobacteria bacterium]|nr:HNH endonuclease [Alphaproteobacteria bacterium]
MSWGFEKGRVYNRRADIHARFGGQQQGGIVTPADPASPIFLITGQEGEAHGYEDTVRPDGVFEYSGEGQAGDMQMIRGNRAVRDHAEEGRDILVFRKVRSGVQYEDQFVCEGFHLRDAPDTTGQMRKAIIFELRPLSALFDADEGTSIPGGIALADLRSRAIAAAKVAPGQRQAVVTAFERSRLICTYVYARADGRCEDCRAPAPFNRPNGTPYLEAHHIRRLTDGGPDDPRYMIALCPNCHRAAHFGAAREDAKARMLSFIAIKEGL